MLTAAASWYTIDQANRLSFAAIAEDAVQRIGDRIENHTILIKSTKAFFEALGEVPTGDQFTTFVADLQESEQFNGIQGIGFARYVETGSPADAFIATELERNFGIGRIPWPQTDQDRRTPIVLLEPATVRNKRALGYDMFSEPVRRAAILAALNERRLYASGAVKLVQENDEDPQAGFLMYTPYFPIGSSQLLGFVYAPFRVNNLFESALNRVPVLPVHVIAWDGQPSPSSLIFQSTEEAGKKFESYTVSSTIEVAGRIWTMTIQPSASYTPQVDQTRSLMLAITALLLAAALAASSRAQQNAIEVGEALRQETERALSDREFLLQEMKHRIKNMIARVLAISRQTARASDSLPDFSQSFSARLHAMAASQDLLARTAWQGADLQTLLMQELRQLFGEEVSEHRLNGQPVELNETAAQAFGLAFHELATNALKYGSARFETGTLDIAWFVESGSDNRSDLVFKWSERSVEPLDAKDNDALVNKGGFGTKLLDATMRIELGGSIHTEPGDYGIDVTIRVPYDRVAAEQKNRSTPHKT
ncbi:CHASE domain-containing protein [Hoeflea sp.]|uniref:CHASE domain-containing protein n=1 Tax=Hoeflea sp. TaxID=1940281 RepID=UPI003747A80D